MCRHGGHDGGTTPYQSLGRVSPASPECTSRPRASRVSLLSRSTWVRARAGPLGPPGPVRSARLNSPTSSFFLGVHTDHEIAAVPEVLDPLVDVAELRVAVRVLPAFDRLGTGLEAEPLFLEQVADDTVSDETRLNAWYTKPPDPGALMTSVELPRGLPIVTSRRAATGLLPFPNTLPATSKSTTSVMASTLLTRYDADQRHDHAHAMTPS